MIIGENARPEDMDVNPTREKQKTNIRTHASDEAIRLGPAHRAVAGAGDRADRPDELVEVTPTRLRLRKRVLDAPPGAAPPSGPARALSALRL
jgi:GTP-binding protein